MSPSFQFKDSETSLGIVILITRIFRPAQLDDLIMLLEDLPYMIKSLLIFQLIL
jgi:hypothetical protein